MTDKDFADSFSEVKKDFLLDTEHYGLTVYRYDTPKHKECIYHIDKKDSIAKDSNWPDMVQSKTSGEIAIITPVYHYHVLAEYKNYIDVMHQAYEEAVILRDAMQKDMKGKN